jgi:hypothetical protein
MKNRIYKTLTLIAFYELIFLALFLLSLESINHRDYKPIYYINIIIYSLIAVLCWVSINYSKVNREIPIFIGIWTTVMTVYSVLFIYQENFSDLFNFYNFNAVYLFSVGFRLYFSSYLFLFAINPIKRVINYLLPGLFISIIVMSITFLPIFISGQYRQSYEYLYLSTYYTQIFNFSMLVIFWYQYTKNKFIFSEYLSNIMSIWTIIIGLEIFHYFSSENELLFHYFAQYFYAILYLIISVLFIFRIIYLQKPISIENEKYIENFYLLKGFVEKPRRGMFVDFYSSLSKISIMIFLVILLSLGIYLYFFNKFTVFIRLSVLILIIASIISVLLAIVTWHRRWYYTIGVLFKKTGKS